jgi:hypothetical protein
MAEVLIRRRKHKCARVRLSNGSIVEVDLGVRKLIPTMNIPGLRTFASCQGTDGRGWDWDEGYVLFGGSLAKPFMHAILCRWLKASLKPLDGLAFENYGNRFVIRWNRRDYVKLLNCARGAVREVREQGCRPTLD